MCLVSSPFNFNFGVFGVLPPCNKITSIYKNKLIIGGHKERQLDIIFPGNTVGEYTFCFENAMSTVAEKLIDFDIMVESEPRRDPPAKPGQVADQTSALEESIFKLNGMLLNVKRTQK